MLSQGVESREGQPAPQPIQERLRERFYREIDRRLDASELSGQEFRRLVQNYCDLLRQDGPQERREDSPLLGLSLEEKLAALGQGDGSDEEE